MAPSSPRARTRTRRSPFSRWRCALPSGLPPGSGQEPSHDAVAPRNAAMGDGRGGAAARPLDARDGGRNGRPAVVRGRRRSEEHTSELQSLMRISYAVFCLKKKKTNSYTTVKQTDDEDNNSSRQSRVYYA